MRHPRISARGALIGTLAAASFAFSTWARADVPDAGVQPGDVDPTFPIVEEIDARAADAGPRPSRVKARVQSVQPVSATADDAGPGATVDETPPAPDADADKAAAPPATTPSVDQTSPAAVTSTARPDPDAERTDAPPPSPPAPAPTAGAAMPEGIGFGGVPALNYDADNGFGFGVVGTLYWYDGKTRPYRIALTLQIFMTSKLIQDHHLEVDWLDVGDLPLRVYGRVGYLQSLTQNYCGIGGDVRCDEKIAKAAAGAAGLSGTAAEDFARHYYQRRFISPYGTVQGRWALVKDPARFEITAGYRGFYFIPGTWDDANKDGKPDLEPYPGSLFAQDHPDGEPGFDSAVTAGFSYDARDNEPAPTSGIWLEGSVRTASRLIGSSWDWSGANLTVRGYAPLMSDHKLVWANRLVLDGVVGTPPVQELARVGGSSDFYVYGGSEAGRGIRAQRYLGNLRMLDQNEVRWRFLDVEAWGQNFGFTTAGFFDLGVVGKELGDPGAMDLLPGMGGALRLSWNENFIVRVDLGFSPIENWAPSLYVTIGNPF